MLYEIKTCVAENRSLTTPFDIVVVGRIAGLTPGQLQEKLSPRMKAGLTWWVEDLINEPEEQVADHIRHGLPRLD